MPRSRRGPAKAPPWLAIANPSSSEFCTIGYPDSAPSSSALGALACSTRDFCLPRLAETSLNERSNVSFMPRLMCLMRPPATIRTSGCACAATRRTISSSSASDFGSRNSTSRTLEQGRLEPKAHGLKRTEAGSHRFITCPLVGDGVVEGAYDVEVEALRGGDGERTSGVADNGERRARATECCGLVEDEPVDGVRLSAGHYPAQCSVSHA